MIFDYQYPTIADNFLDFPGWPWGTPQATDGQNPGQGGPLDPVGGIAGDNASTSYIEGSIGD